MAWPGIAALGDDYSGKYHDVWGEPIMMTLGLGVITRLILLVLMIQTRKNFGTGLKNFSMHRQYILPERLRSSLSPEHAEGIKAMVRGLHLIGSLELREYAVAATAAKPAANANAATPAGGPQGSEHGRHKLFTNRRRFFQLSNDLTTLRWSWREYLLLDEVVRYPSRGAEPRRLARASLTATRSRHLRRQRHAVRGQGPRRHV